MGKLSGLPTETTFALTDFLLKIKAGGSGDVKVSLSDFLTAAGFGAWQSWTPTWTNLTIGNATISAKYMQVGKMVTGRVKVTWGNTTSASGIVEFTAPTTLNSDYGAVELIVGHATGINIGTAVWQGVVKAIGSNLLTFSTPQTASGSNPQYINASSGNDWTASIPFTWTNGSIMFGTFFYEAA